MEMSSKEKLSILESNLNELKSKKGSDESPNLIKVKENVYQQFIVYLKQEERKEDCILLEDNKYKLLEK